MAPPAVGIGTLRRLSELDTGGHPVLSVYLGLDPASDPSALAATYARELDAVIACMGRRTAASELGSLHELLRRVPLAYGMRSLALFSYARGAAVEAVALPSPVEPMAVTDTLPWLEPLAGIFTPGDDAVAVVDHHVARLFRGAPRLLVEFATVHDERHCRPALGDCSPQNRTRPSEEHLAEHVDRLATLLLRANRRRAFDRLVVIAPRGLWPTLEGALHSDLRARLTGFVELDVIDASPQEIARAVARHAHSDRAQRRERSSRTALPVPVTIEAVPDATALTLV